MIGPLKKAEGGFRFLLVMADKFTKCIEAKPVISQVAKPVIKFLSGVIHRYGMPHIIIKDNGKNFMSKKVKDYCADCNIKLDFASVAHLQSNGHVEWANGLVLGGLKPRLVTSLKDTDGKWIDELDSVLWSLRTTPNRPTGYTPFFMEYGAEAVLPSDLEHDAPRIRRYVECNAELRCQDEMDALVEARDVAIARSAIYQQQLRHYQVCEVRGQAFNISNLILHLIQDKKGLHKLSPPWEGPFIIDEVLHDRAYRIRHAETSFLEPNSWNIALLRHFYT
jgi:hypothetical protein